MLRTPFLLLLLCVLSVPLHSHEHTHAHSHAHSHSHAHDHSHEPPHFRYSREANMKFTPTGFTANRNMRTESAQQLWSETSAAVLLISLAPFLVLCLMPDLAKHRSLLKIFLAFAAGGLLGDAFLHLIPHAIDRHHQDAHNDEPHQHEGHDHKRHMVVGLSIVAGIFLFLCVEKLVRVFQGSGHGHSHGAQSAPVTAQQSANEASQKSKKGKKGSSGDDTSHKQQHQQQQQQPIKKAVKHGSATELKVAGYLNLAADFTHNFTDGLAIGASFLMSRQAGMVTTLTVLIHELPHEIGDYAILIRSGCSARKAMFLQLSTAIGAALGASLSLLAAGVGLDSLTTGWNVPVLTDELITSCVLPFTAGGFIYIAMASVLPDLLASDQDSGMAKRPATHWCRRITQSIVEVLALVAGIGMMAALGLMEK